MNNPFILFQDTQTLGWWDLNTFISGGLGAGGLGLVYFVVKLILDRTIPSRSDSRASVTLVLEGLNNMVKVLQEEKLADSSRLKDKQGRIDLLETAADKDYDRISELRTEVIDLRNRLATKDRHINTLITELRKLGAQVTGVSLPDALEDTEIEITHNTVAVRKILNTSQSESTDSSAK